MFIIHNQLFTGKIIKLPIGNRSISPHLQEVYQLRRDLKAIFDLDLTKDQASLKIDLFHNKFFANFVIKH